MANLVRSGDKSSFARKRIITFDSHNTRTGFCLTSTIERTQSFQIIGKDIHVPAHGIYWLIMLHTIGFPNDAMPQLLVHGWWNLGGAKMSKSAGNVIDPFVLADKYGAEALRFYLVSDIATGKDAD